MNKKDIPQLLTTFPIFKDLSEEEMSQIVNIAEKHVYRPGTHIFMQDDSLTNVYFIQKGTIKIYRTDIHGKEQIVNILVDGQMFPHQGFFRNGNYPAHAQVLKEAHLIFIPIRSFELVLANNPQMCIKIFHILGDKIVDLQNRLEEQILHNTYEQIIALLLRLAKNYGVEKGKDLYVVKHNFTNRDLANMIGSSRETVNRTLNQLKKNNLISIDAEGNFIINIENLKKELH